MTTEVDDRNALTDTEYAEWYLWPERSELDLRVWALLRGRGWKSAASGPRRLPAAVPAMARPPRRTA